MIMRYNKVAALYVIPSIQWSASTLKTTLNFAADGILHLLAVSRGIVLRKHTLERISCRKQLWCRKN